MKILLNKQRFLSSVFDRSYTTPIKGRSKTTSFGSSRPWHKRYGKEMWNTYQKHNCKFMLLWGDPAISKSHFSLAFGEALPFNGNRLVIVHTKNLQNQTGTLIQHYVQQGYLTKRFRVDILHKLYAVIQSLNSNKEMNVDDLELINYLNNVEYIVLDELHKYSLGNDVKMVITILDYLFTKGKAKLVLGTTATGRRLHRIWKWAGTFVNRKQFTFKPTKAELIAEGYAPVTPCIIHCDTHTKVFDKYSVEAQNIKIDENDPAFQQELIELEQDSIDESAENLVAEDHKLRFRDDVINNIREKLLYQRNRVDVAVKHYHKKHKGESAIISVRMISEAIKYADEFNQKYGPGVAIAWNSEGKNTHPVYKNNERKMLDDLTNPKHPLKVVFVNLMLREGTNESITATYQCVWNSTHSGVDSSIQTGTRGIFTYILLDAQNTARLPRADSQDVFNALKEKVKEAGLEMTDEEIAQMQKVYLTGKAVETAKTPEGDTPDVGLDIEHILKTLQDHSDDITDSEGGTWTNIATKDTWVYSVEHKGDVKTIPLDVDNDINQHTTLIESIDELFKGGKKWI